MGFDARIQAEQSKRGKRDKREWEKKGGGVVYHIHYLRDGKRLRVPSARGGGWIQKNEDIDGLNPYGFTISKCGFSMVP